VNARNIQAGATVAANDRSAEKRCSILFVEDNEDHFALAWHQLRKMNVSNPPRRVGTVDEMIAYLAGDGIYSDRDEFPLPSLIFLDLRLPSRSGVEAQAWLRSKLKFRTIPIILISTPDMVVLLESAVRLGATAFMTKPFDGHEFRRVILEHKLSLDFAQG
jgi:CheY-like chemotaxis protein